MKVILTKSVPKLGKANDVIDVPDGYAANALFPKRLAVPATPAALATLAQKQKNAITAKQIQHDLLDRAVQSLEGQTLVYATKANDKGSLFSKVDEVDVARELMEKHRISIDSKCITIREGVIKHTGTYSVDITDGSFKSAITLRVVAA